jgi:hypothetical protein
MTEPVVGADLWRQVVAAAMDRCQCTGACGKRHLTPERKPGRCEAVEGRYAGPKKGRAHLLALPRNPLLPWHRAASLPARNLIAFCPDCADGVRRALNRGVKAQAPQPDGLFDAAPYQAADGGDVT